MSDLSRFDGVFTALITPFTQSGDIDWVAFDRLIDRQLAAGITGLVPVGTTGEAATLTSKEADALIAHTVKRAKGKAYVLAGTGSNSTAKTIAATQRATELGVDGVLIVTPYYNKPSQQGLLNHFSAVADATTADVVLYSVPGRAGVEIAPDTAGALAQRHLNIVAIKEAGGAPSRVTDLRTAAPGLAIHCGDDGLALAFYALGSCGLTSVFSNYDPEICVELYKAWQAGDRLRALDIHEALRDIADAMFIENSPAPVKYVLSNAGFYTASVRMPLAEVSAPSRSVLDQHVMDFKTRREGLALQSRLEDSSLEAQSPWPRGLRLWVADPDADVCTGRDFSLAAKQSRREKRAFAT